MYRVRGIKLSGRQIYLACSVKPTADGDATIEQVRKWKKQLAGKVVHENWYNMFTAFDSRGRKKYFEYCHQPVFRDKCSCIGSFESAKKDSKMWASK